METLRVASEKAITGCLVGTAIGDAIGLPVEGLSRRRIRSLFGGVPVGHRLLFGRGMVSDDTEHTILVAEALIASAVEPEAFEREMARGMRRWICLLPAGVGLATLRACLRLLVGIPASRSGVRSAGNGPAMRSALLGVAHAGSGSLAELVRRSTHLTHTDPKAEYGALAVAVAANRFAAGVTDVVSIGEAISEALPDDADAADALRELLARAERSIVGGESTARFAAERLGLSERVSGYVYHTVPVAIHAALSFPGGFRQAIYSAVECGGDTDTVAAITGGIVGAHVGIEGIPQELLGGLIEWPQDIHAMTRLAKQLAGVLQSDARAEPQRPPVAALLARNLFFTGVVLYHGLRRCLPPY